MLVSKIYIRPQDPHSEELAIQEVEGYCRARNAMTAIKARFERLRQPGVEILPEWQERAAQEAQTERTGRKPTPKALVRCGEPLNPRSRITSKEVRLSMGTKYEDALTKLRTQWGIVEIVETGLGRDAHQELHALANREAYAARQCHYATWWLAEAASKKAEHPLRAYDEGRAGMLPEHLVITGDVMQYQGTTWTLNRKQLGRIHAIQPKQCWIQRERATSSLRDLRASMRPRYEWYLVLVYDLDRELIAAPDQHGTVAINTGWTERNAQNPLRTAYWVDDSGNHGSLDMDPTAWQSANDAHAIAAAQDLDAKELIRELGMPSNTAIPTAVKRARDMGVLTERVQHIVHLDEYHRGKLSRAVRHRDYEYQHQADQLCTRYSRIVIEDVNYSVLIQKTKKTEAKSSETLAGGARQLKAPGTFIKILRLRAALHGCEIIEVKPLNHSRTCTCGHDMGPSMERIRSCAKCTARWDVDRLCATNSLTAGLREIASARVVRESPSPLAESGSASSYHHLDETDLPESAE